MTCQHVGRPEVGEGGNSQELKVNTSGTKIKRATLDVIIEDIVGTSSLPLRVVLSVNKSVAEVAVWRTEARYQGEIKRSEQLLRVFMA